MGEVSIQKALLVSTVIATLAKQERGSGGDCMNYKHEVGDTYFSVQELWQSVSLSGRLITPDIEAQWSNGVFDKITSPCD